MKKIHLLVGLIGVLWMAAGSTGNAQHFGRSVVVRGPVVRDCGPRFERVFVGYTRFGEPIWRTVRVGYVPPVCAPVVVRRGPVVCAPVRARYAPVRGRVPVRYCDRGYRGARGRR